VETTLLDFLHIYNVLILLCTVSALRYRRIGEPHVQSDTSGLHLQVDSLLACCVRSLTIDSRLVAVEAV
jgi:hypothetical protein